MSIRTFLQIWAARAAACVGLAAGDVDEDTAAHFRLVASAFASLALLTFVILRFTLSAAWGPTLHPVINEWLPWHTSHVTVVNVLPKGADLDPRYPYGFWTSDLLKWTYNVDPHVRIGDRVLDHLDHGNIVRYQVIHGKLYWSPWTYVPPLLGILLMLLAGAWALCVVFALRSLYILRCIRLDCATGLVRRSAHVEMLWCPWSAHVLARVAFPLAVPLTLRDARSGRIFVVHLPVQRLQGLTAQNVLGGEAIEVAYYPRTGAVVGFSSTSIAEGTPWPVGGRRTRQLLRRLHLQRAGNVGWVTPEMFSAIRRATVGLSVAGLMFFGAAVLTAPDLVPYWLPRYHEQERVARVYAPYTTEPSGYPWEIKTNFGRTYSFASDPRLRVGDTFTTLRDWRGEYLGSTSPARTYHSSIENHPLDLFVVLATALLYLWRTRKRAREWKVDTRGELLTERVVPLDDTLERLSTNGAFWCFGYPVLVQRVSSGERIALRISSVRMPAVRDFFEDARGFQEPLEVSYYARSREIVRLAGDGLRALDFTRLEWHLAPAADAVVQT